MTTTLPRPHHLTVLPVECANACQAVHTWGTSYKAAAADAKDRERSVVRVDPDVLATRVAWNENQLVVADRRRGDVLGLNLAD